MSPKQILATCVAVLAAGVLVLTMAAPATATYRPRLTFNLTVLGDVPADAQFGVYVQTDPPPSDRQTHFWFCANGNEPVAGCGPGPRLKSGDTMTVELSMPTAPDSAVTTIAYRFDRVVRRDGFRWPQDWQSVYSGRVTLRTGDGRGVVNLTYDYNLGLPNTAMAPLQPDGGIVPVLLLTGAVVCGFGVWWRGYRRPGSAPR
jgi:hypothetical protein